MAKLKYQQKSTNLPYQKYQFKRWLRACDSKICERILVGCVGLIGERNQMFGWAKKIEGNGEDLGSFCLCFLPPIWISKNSKTRGESTVASPRLLIILIYNNNYYNYNYIIIYIIIIFFFLYLFWFFMSLWVFLASFLVFFPFNFFCLI